MIMTSKESKNAFSEKLRKLIKERSESTYEIGREARVNPGSLLNFLKGGGLSINNVDRLIEYFHLDLDCLDENSHSDNPEKM